MSTEYEHEWRRYVMTLFPGETYERCARCGAHRSVIPADHTCPVPPTAPSLGEAIKAAPTGLDAIDQKFRKG